MIYLGIDPGIHGALVLLDSEGCRLGAWPMPTIRGKIEANPIWQTLQEIRAISHDRLEIVQVAIEKVFTMPSDVAAISKQIDATEADTGNETNWRELRKLVNQRDGRVGILSYGRTAGIIEGCVAAMEWPYMLVSPRTWQREMWKGTDKGPSKARSYTVAKRFWPNDTMKFDRGRKEFHDGLVDALLMAEYIRRLASNPVDLSAKSA